MRFVVAKRAGLRGSGLGNEMLPWAKGWVASQVLDAHLVGPSWGINKRRYYRNFGTTRLDFALEDTLLRLPHHAFREQEYRATGEVDFGAAIGSWAAERGLTRKRSYIVSVEGMWGGYSCIRTARPFLLAKLLNSRDALRNVYQVISKLNRKKLFVAVHMRSAGDGFLTSSLGECERGRWNIAIPGEWYQWVCEKLLERYDDRIEFRFFTDRGGTDFEEAVRRFNPGQSRQHGLTECSDLLLMAQAGLRVCSISSYSLAASFLSDGPYLWYKPQLTVREGLYTLWGHETAQQADVSLTSRSIDFVRRAMAGQGNSHHLPIGFLGAAMDTGDPLPETLVALLDQQLWGHDPRTNLIEYGCLPLHYWPDPVL